MGVMHSTATFTNGDGDNVISSVSGQVKLIKIGHTWSIGRFRGFCDRKATGEAIVSPIFFTGSNNRYQWRLVLYPKGDKRENNQYVSLYLQLVSKDVPSCLGVRSAFAFSLLNEAGESLYKITPSGKQYFVKDRTLWGYGRFIKRSEVLDYTNKFLNGSGVDRRIIIFCENIDGEPTNDIPTECNLLHMAVCKNIVQVSSDLEELMHNEDLSDFKIFAGEEQVKMHAHKVILAARSPVFAATFKHNMLETKGNEVYVPDVRPEIMRELMRFMYCGRVENLDSCVHELLIAADKYALEDLKDLCEEVLFSKLNIHSAVDTLVFTDLYNSEKLKARVTAFIINNSKQVAETPAFKSAVDEHPKLLAEIFQKLALER